MAIQAPASQPELGGAVHRECSDGPEGCSRADVDDGAGVFLHLTQQWLSERTLWLVQDCMLGNGAAEHNLVDSIIMPACQ